MSEKLGPLPDKSGTLWELRTPRNGKPFQYWTEQDLINYAAQEVAKERERCANRLNDTAGDYRAHAKKQDQHLAARFAAYATALDDAAEDIRKMQS